MRSWRNEATTSTCPGPSARAATRAGRAATAGREQHDVVTFEAWKIGGEELAPRHDHDVEGDLGLVAAEQFARDALGAIADDGPADLARGRDPEAGCGSRAGRGVGAAAIQHEHRHEAPVALHPTRVDVFEVGPAADTLRGWQGLIGHGPGRL